MIYMFYEDYLFCNCKLNKMCKSLLIRFYLYVWNWLIFLIDMFIIDKLKLKFKCYFII